ncbi:MAG TPA: PP2C family protein-serine/threonine phosphatase [Solirubrobacteraceae bacterium]|nr:PP2C family protein-serine/threonine phosphatase [Solirubrobacteraceae bacterium]
MEPGEAAIADAAEVPSGEPDLESEERTDDDADLGAGGSFQETGSRSRWRLSRQALLTLALGLLITAAFSIAALELYNHNETRLLRLRARELSLVLRTAVPTLQTPLASGAELANATGGSPQKFRAFMDPLVGPRRQFTSVSLWPAEGRLFAPRVVVGAQPTLATLPAEARRLFAQARQSGQLVLTGLLPGPTPKLGYAFAVPSAHGGYVVYAENPLPASKRSKIAEGTGFEDLDYALYLGRSRRRSDLLVGNISHFPITGRQASTVVPFGRGAFTLVVTPARSLGGTFFENLPWLIAIVGVLVSMTAAALTERIIRRRADAERLAVVLDRVASENRQMYTQQRGIAQTLQHALLPEALPEIPGLSISASYVPAAAGIDVGGDWYDIVPCGGDSALLLIGDVSGHGLRAATTMASLRHAALAYAAVDPSPSSVLSKLSNFVNSSAPDYFATMLCMRLDVAEHRVSVASAGHLPPLLLADDQARLLEFEPDVAIGVTRDWQYHETEVSIPPRATLVAYTDGLVERRGESLDAGLERLCRVASAGPQRLEELVAGLARDLPAEEHDDDTAIVGIQWRT